MAVKIKQKLKKNETQKSEALDFVEIRPVKTKQDMNKVAELWANLAMVQQMQDIPTMLEQQRESGLEWFPFVASLAKQSKNKFIVMEDPEKIFGFIYIESKIVNQGKTQASIQEMYIEPSHKDLPQDELAIMIKESLELIGIDQIQFS